MRTTISLKAGLLAAATLFATPGVALAQSTAQPAPAAQPAAQPATPPAAAAQNSGAPEIIVTAQRRSESIQKTSLAIDVLSADTIQKAGITQPTDISSVTPGIQISQAGANFQVYVRGVGDFTATPLNDPAVAQSIDGVFSATGATIGGNMFDLDRMELLKGPQGTLYGRNSSGGAVNLLPTAPKLGVFEGYASLDVENYNGVTVEGAINVPLATNLAARVSYQVVSRDGYLDDGTDDDRHQSFRAQLLFKPTDNLSIKLFGSYEHVGGRGGGYALYEPNGTSFGPAMVPSNPWTSALPELNAQLAQLNLALTNGASSTALFAPFDPSLIQQNNSFWSIHALVEANLGFATLTFIPAYQSANMNYLIEPALPYSTYVPGSGPEYSHATSAELRLSNSNSKIKWVVGGFFYNNDLNANQVTDFGPAAWSIFDGNLNTRSYAAFGEVTYSLTKAFRLIGGIRFTDETKSIDNAHEYNGYGSLACPTPGTGPNSACVATTLADKSYRADKVNYRVGFEYDLAPQNMLWGTVATGFKSGGQTISNFPAYQPETVTAFTLGSKNRFFNGLLQFNLELFYWKYNNKQENITLPDPTNPNAVVQTVVNAGAAVSKGVSADVIVRPTRNDSLHFAVEYDDAYYTSFQYNPTAVVTTGCTQGSAPEYTVDCTGRELARTPAWSGSVDYTHDFLLANGGKLSASGSMTFASSRWLEVTYLPNDLAPAYTLWNANLSYTPSGGGFTVEAFVRNIGNQAVYSGAQYSPMVAGFVAVNINPPRTYGARIRVNF